MSAPQSGWVTIAVLGKTRGNRGEVTATALSDRPDRFQSLAEVWLFGQGERFEVETTWFHEGVLIFKFRGVDSISAAERLARCEVRVPVAQRVALDEGEFFQDDLVGCQVIDRASGASLGVVTRFDESGGAGNLVVGDTGLLIPFARSICVEIDPASRRIAVELPAGLKELNQP